LTRSSNSPKLGHYSCALYYRLAKAAPLTGADLRNGNDRLALHLGFKLGRLNGSYPPAGPASS
jgi:sugar diacid utilization regulator